MTPTLDIYSALQNAFDHFNEELFGGTLPQCLITLRSSTRSYGYMHRQRFMNISGKPVDELGINPGYFALQSIEEVMATVVHEMVHHWQNHFGNPSRSLHHNREWACKMEEIGLMPSDTGLPGGKRTGRTMSDYIIADGLFIKSCGLLSVKNIRLPWFDSHLSVAPERMAAKRDELVQSGVAIVGGEAPIHTAQTNGVKLPVIAPIIRKSPERVRQTCPKCQIRAWTAPGTPLSCGVCGVAMEEPLVTAE